MDKTFTLLQILSLPTEYLTEEDIDHLTGEWLINQNCEPDECSIHFILGYAQSMNMIYSEQTGDFSCSMN